MRRFSTDLTAHEYSEDSRTFVFLTSAFIAPTPPRSPPDIPSTSSMIRHVLWVIATPVAVVFCVQQSERTEDLSTFGRLRCERQRLWQTDHFGACEPAVQTRVVDVGPMLDQLLASRIGRVELEGRVPARDRDDVSGGRLPDPWRARDEDPPEGAGRVLAWLLEVALVGRLPVVEPLLQSLDVGLVAADLAQSRRRVLCRPQLRARQRGRPSKSPRQLSEISSLPQTRARHFVRGLTVMHSCSVDSLRPPSPSP